MQIFIDTILNESESSWISIKNQLDQGRREGVKGVTVSRGPDLKRGPGNHENNRKIGYSKENSFIMGPKSTDF
jgi:hypothetical protein